MDNLASDYHHNVDLPLAELDICLVKDVCQKTTSNLSQVQWMILHSANPAAIFSGITIQQTTKCTFIKILLVQNKLYNSIQIKSVTPFLYDLFMDGNVLNYLVIF